MDFLSIRFLVFVVCTLVIYNCFNDTKMQRVWLLTASYFFYAFLDSKFLLLLVTLSVWTWYIGEKLRNKGRNRNLCLLGIGGLLSFLLYFKYYNFFIDICAKSIRGGNKEVLKVVMPVGISFYIFQAISYILDMYNEKLDRDYFLGEVLLYIGFFPKIMSGPIVKARDFSHNWKRFIKSICKGFL